MLQKTQIKDLEVTALSMGTTKFGPDLNAAQIHEQMSFYLDAGGNFIDTALIYGFNAPTGQGTSERMLGSWLKANGHRHDLVIATKGCHPLPGAFDVQRVIPQAILTDVDESLCNLGVDEIDLYFLHRDDESIPVGDLLYTLEEQKRKGKIRHYGCSNWKLSRMQEAMELAQAEGWEGFVCNQIRWSLAKINEATIPSDMTYMNDSFYHFHQATKMPAMAYSSIANGYLQKKLAGKPVSQGMEQRYGNADNEALLQRMKTMDPQEAGALPYHFFLQQNFPSIAISSFSNLDQLKNAMENME